MGNLDMVQRIWAGKGFGLSKLEKHVLVSLAILVAVGLAATGIWYVADRWSELTPDGRVSGIGLLLAATAAIAAVAAVLIEVRIDAARRAREATAVELAAGPEIASRVPDYFDMFKETMKAWGKVQDTYGSDYVPKKYPDYGYAIPFKVYPPSREAFIAVSPLLGALTREQSANALAADRFARETRLFATRRVAREDELLPKQYYCRFSEHFFEAIKASIWAAKALGAQNELVTACRDAHIAALRYVEHRKAYPLLYDQVQELLELNSRPDSAARKNN